MTLSKLQKKKNNTSSTYWKTKCDTAWGALIHAMYNVCAMENVDVTDPCAGNLEAHHLISRGRIVTRHSPECGVLLCSKHHKFSKICSPHASPIGFSRFMEIHRPVQYAWVLEHLHDTQESRPNYKERLVELEYLLHSTTCVSRYANDDKWKEICDAASAAEAD